MDNTPNNTPILESVFRDLANYAEDFSSIVSIRPLVPLCWTELAEWTDEIATGESTVYDHAGVGIGIFN